MLSPSELSLKRFEISVVPFPVSLQCIMYTFARWTLFGDVSGPIQFLKILITKESSAL